ncbi:MAG TPA: helix-turn-helix domain-containing protein [Bacteroidales bacterium]|nr:helix-turn-helix domain-containing protein [Bacteroidales bacterium]
MYTFTRNKKLIKESIHEEIETFLRGLNQKTIPERLSLIETAQYLGVSKSYMYKLTHTRTIPFNKFGKRVIFYTKELEDCIKNTSLRHKSREEIEREASENIVLGARKKLNRRHYFYEYSSML